MGNVSPTFSSPNPGTVAQVPIDLNNLSRDSAKALDTLRSWTATPSGKVELRFKQMDPTTGLKVYEAKGGKSTVTIRATSFAEAAKQADKLVAAKALAPRGTAALTNKKPKASGGDGFSWSRAQANPKAQVQIPTKPSFLGTSPGLPSSAPRAAKTTAPRAGKTPAGTTSDAKANLLPLTPKLSSGSSPEPAVRVRNPLILGDSNGTELGNKFVSPFRPCPTDSTAAPAKSANDPKAKKAAPNPRSIATYSVLSAVASYNINLATGMPAAKALALLPAGAARDIISVALAQLPLDSIKNPYLEVTAKGVAGGVVTLLSNVAARKAYGAKAWPETHIHGGMVLAAFTTNGFVVGLKDLQKQGYLGGLPPDNPQGFKQWFRTYGQEAAAIGGGVGVAITSVVTGKEVLNKIAGQGFDAKKILTTLGLSTILPFAQSLMGRAATTSLCPAVPAETKNSFSLKTMIVDALNYMGGSAMTDKVLGKPVTKIGVAKGFGMGLGLAVIAEQLNLVGTDYKVKQYTHEDLENINTAREALTDITTVLTHPGKFLLGASREGGNAAYIDALKAYKEVIYKLHPTLRPTSK